MTAVFVPSGAAAWVRRAGHRRPAPRVLPAAPLLDLLPRRNLSKTVHCNGIVAARAIVDGLTVAQAERWAARIGYHPAEVWGDLWWAVAG